MNSYFQPIDDSDAGSKMNQYFTFNHNGLQVVFKKDNGSKIKAKTMKLIVDGLNHMLAWVQDFDNIPLTGEERKKEEMRRMEFLQKFFMYMMHLKSELTTKKFEDEVIEGMKKGKDHNDVRAEILRRTILWMPDEILDVIIEYVDQNTFNNTENNSNHDTSLDEIDILTLNCVITVSKIITIAFSILPKMKIEFYTYTPIMNSVDMIANRLALNYFINVKTKSAIEIANIQKKSLTDTVYNFIYLTINGPDKTSDKEDPLGDLFKNNGVTKGKINDSIFKNLMTSIYKNVPIDYANTSSSVKYETFDDYRHFKFVNKNTIKYIKDIITKMLKHQYSITHPHLVNTHDLKNSDDDYSSALKQEIYLEKRNLSDIKRRRQYIEILKKYADDYFVRHNLVINKIIERTPLADYFIVKLLQEVGEDYLSSKLLDIRTYNKLINVISHVLFERYPQISLALTTDDTTPSTKLRNKSELMSKVSNLIVARRYDKMVEQNLEKIVEVTYRFNNGAQMIDISDEFITYLLKEQDGTNNIKFIDTYIYNYE